MIPPGVVGYHINKDGVLVYQGETSVTVIKQVDLVIDFKEPNLSVWASDTETVSEPEPLFTYVPVDDKDKTAKRSRNNTVVDPSDGWNNNAAAGTAGVLSAREQQQLLPPATTDAAYISGAETIPRIPHNHSYLRFNSDIVMQPPGTSALPPRSANDHAANRASPHRKRSHGQMSAEHIYFPISRKIYKSTLSDAPLFAERPAGTSWITHGESRQAQLLHNLNNGMSDRGDGARKVKRISFCDEKVQSPGKTPRQLERHLRHDASREAGEPSRLGSAKEDEACNDRASPSDDTSKALQEDEKSSD